MFAAFVFGLTVNHNMEVIISSRGCSFSIVSEHAVRA